MKYEIGTNLATKDGMRVGNAVVVGHALKPLPGTSARFTVNIVRTDFGNVMHLTDIEMYNLFTPRIGDKWPIGELALEARNMDQKDLLCENEWGII